MKRIRTMIFIVTAAICFAAAGYGMKGNAQMSYTNQLEGALSEQGLATFFDVARGKPQIEWNQGEALVKSGYLQSKNDIDSQSYTFAVDVKGTEDVLRFRLDLGRAGGKKTLTQITLDSAQNAITTYDGVGTSIVHDFGGKLRAGTWFQLKVVADHQNLSFFVDGVLAISLENQEGFAGKFSLRSTGGAVALRNLSCYYTTGTPVVHQTKQIGILEGYQSVVLPGVEQSVKFHAASQYSGTLSAEVHDASGKRYEQRTLTKQDDVYTFTYIPRGTAGVQTVTLYQGDTVIGKANVYVEARTIVRTEDASFNKFYDKLISQVTTRNQPQYNIDGHTFKMHMSWLRDHIHMMEAGIYWQTGYKEVLDFWLDHQHPDGFFYEMILDEGTDAWRSFTGGSDQKFYKRMDNGKYVLRFEIEADIEYLVVDAVHMAWQTTGDTEWMLSKIPNLEKALTWIMTNPERWSKAYGLPIRGSSVDTYDFTYGHNTANRRVVWWEDGMDWGTPMAIFHGDCTGFYQACQQLAEMYRAAGNTRRAEHWESVGNKVQENLVKATWNGNYFAHMVQVHPTLEELPKDWQEDLSGDWTRLSYSNSCALNRNFLTQSQATSIINSFKALRDNPPKQETPTGYSEESLFAEWVTIYPSYRKKDYVKYDPGCYINGAVAPFCGGELANGCFKWGYADYGYDIIQRLKVLCERDNGLKFFYRQNGEIYYYSGASSGGPDAWGAAVTHNAIVEGLAGFASESASMKDVTLTPSWTVTDYNHSYASVSYGAGKQYMAYTWDYDQAAEKLNYQIVGDSTNVTLNLLMPEGKTPVGMTINGQQVQYQSVSRAHSAYAQVTYSRTSNTQIDVIEVHFTEGTLPDQATPPTTDAELNPWKTPGPVPTEPPSGNSNKGKSGIGSWILLAIELVAALGIATGTAIFLAKKSLKKKS